MFEVMGKCTKPLPIPSLEEQSDTFEQKAAREEGRELSLYFSVLMTPSKKTQCKHFKFS